MEAPSASAMRPGRGGHAGSLSAFRERHASLTRESRGAAGCLPRAPRVPGEGAARARRVPPGCAARPSTKKARAASREGLVCAMVPGHSVERTLILLKTVPGPLGLVVQHHFQLTGRYSGPIL